MPWVHITAILYRVPMKQKDMLLALAAGIALGSIIGLGGFGYTSIANRYWLYGTARLAALALRENLNRYTAWFGVGVLAYYGVSVLLVSKAKLKATVLFRIGVLAAALLFVGLSANWVLKTATRFTLPLVARMSLARLAAVAQGKVPVGHYVSLLRARPVEATLVAGCLALVAVLVWVVGRLDWSRARALTRARRGPIVGTGIAFAALVTGANLWVYAKYAGEAGPGPNVILIVVDCLRPDHLGCYGYDRDTSPHLDALSDRGVLFTGAYANAPWTKPSVATIFTSLYPNAHTAVGPRDVLPRGALTMGEIFKEVGYTTHFLCGGNPSISREFGFSEGFDSVVNPDSGMSASALTDRLLSLSQHLRQGNVFAYVHYMDAHLPYNRNAHNDLFTGGAECAIGRPGEFYLDDIRRSPQTGDLFQEIKEYLIALYDGQIRFVDDSIGRIVAFLEEEGLLERTLLLVTSDHGEEFWEHGNFEHGHTVYEEVIRVPLIIAGGGLKPNEISARVRLLDLLPTVAGLVGAEIAGAAYHGVDLSGQVRSSRGGGAGLPVFAMATLYGMDKACIVSGEWKLILNDPTEPAGKVLVGYEADAGYEIYNLANDAAEVEDLIEAEPEKAAYLMDDLVEFRSVGAEFTARKTVIDGSLERKLKALGYL